MNCLLTLARRDGVRLSKSGLAKPDSGSLVVLPSQMDNLLGRSVTVARFMGTRHHELINVEIVMLEGTTMVLSGLERKYSPGGGRADYAQTWVVKLTP